MALGKYRTLFEVGGPCVIIVIDDSSFGIIERFQFDQFGARFGTELGPTDFAAIARGFGGCAWTVTDRKELESALASAFFVERTRFDRRTHCLRDSLRATNDLAPC